MSIVERRPKPHNPDDIRDYCLAVRMEARNRAADSGKDEIAERMDERIARIKEEEFRDDERDRHARLAKVMGL
jgi:hypothetical protein